MNTSIALKAEHITKSYQGAPIIEDICLELHTGELVCLLGVSGIGKTTLFHIMSGLETPDSGEVTAFGGSITGVSGKVSYMQQKDLLLPFETILNNVALPLRLRGMGKKQAAEQAMPYLGEFGLEGCEKKYPSQLSGGMRQRAALLRAYLYSDKLMLLDEPFSALDAITKSSLHQWFRTIVSTHQTSTLFITHDIDEAIVLSDRIYIMSGPPGRITYELTVSDVKRETEEFMISQKFMDYKRTILQHIHR